MVSLNFVTDSFSKGISIFMNGLENFFAPFIVFFLILMFFVMQYLLIRFYFGVARWIVDSFIPFIANIHVIADSYAKFREMTSTGLFNDKTRNENRDKV